MAVLLGGWLAIDSQVRPATKVWFYDLATGQLFAGGTHEPPPIRPPRADQQQPKSGVLASVISIDGESEQRIVYLLSYAPEAKQLIEQKLAGQPLPANAAETMSRGTLIAKPPERPGEEPRWVEASSAEGQQITFGAIPLAAGRTFRVSLP